MSRPSAIERRTVGFGLPLVLAPQPHLHRSTVSYVLAVGARYEDAETSGLSHFLEHMMHRGSRALPSAHAQALAIEGLGATLDASTALDHGTFTITAPPENLAEAAELLGRILTEPAFTDIDVERGIVREELLEERDHRGKLIDADGLARALLFGAHPLGLPILGAPRTLRSFKVQHLRAHHARHYTSRTAALAVAGRIPSKRELVRALERGFRAHPPGERLARKRFYGREGLPIVHVVRSAGSQIAVRVAILGPGRKDGGEPAVDLLLRILDDGTSTRLYRRISDELGLCYEVSAAFEAYDEIGLLDVAAEAEDEGALRALSEILLLLRELAESGPTASEVEKAKARSKWYAERAADQPEATSEQAAFGLITGGPIFEMDRHARLARLEPADVRRAARRFLRPDRLAVVLVGPVTRALEQRARAIVGQWMA